MEGFLAASRDESDCAGERWQAVYRCRWDNALAADRLRQTMGRCCCFGHMIFGWYSQKRVTRGNTGILQGKLVS